MNQPRENLLPLECLLEMQAKNKHLFPPTSGNYFDRYVQIKEYLKENVYPHIGAGTSAEDQGIYTSHDITHFNSVINYAGKLLDLPINLDYESLPQKLKLDPYEIYILLVSILLHDAGNVFGRRGHEKKALMIFKDMGRAVCPDEFEAAFIAKIAEVHGGKAKSKNGKETKDTIRNSNLEEQSSYGSIKYRPSLIAAIVRFADEICEDRSRSAKFLMANNGLPIQSEVYHAYAKAISSVDVDLNSKFVSIKFELTKSDVLRKKGKDKTKTYLIDEIALRLEKMYCELCYCRAFMMETIPINKIRATVTIFDDNHQDRLKDYSFELCESGYPNSPFLFKTTHPEWTGTNVKKQIREGT